MTASAVAAIGERLREARLRRGISVRGLARSVDVSASLISQIETGKSSPSVSTLYAITTALGISIEDVFGEPDATREDATGRGGTREAGIPAGGRSAAVDPVAAGTAGGGAASGAGTSATGTSGAETSGAETGGAGASGAGTDNAGTSGAGSGIAEAGGGAAGGAEQGGAAVDERDGRAAMAALAGLAAGLATGPAQGSPVVPAEEPAASARPPGQAPLPGAAPRPPAEEPSAGSPGEAAGGGTGEAAGGPGASRPEQSATARGLRMLSQKRLVGPVVRSDEREVLHLDSGVTWELLGQLPYTHVDFLRITYAPGGRSSSSGMLMRHSGTEFGHVLSGRLTLTLGFESYELGPGDSVCFDSSTPHSYANDGAEPAVGVWFVLEHFR